MNLAQIAAIVTQNIKRPDKASAIRDKINHAIHRMHTSHYYEQDLVELSVAVDPANATSFNVPRSSVPGIRKIKYIQPAGQQLLLTKLDPTQVFCKSSPSLNIYYMTGSDIIVRLAATAPQLLIGYYSYLPPLIDDTDSNWITEHYGYVVADGASAMMYSAIGDEESARGHEGRFQQGLQDLKTDLIYGAAGRR